ncbi:MAG TPA: hypothetical protein PKH33_18205 [bacterium]|nr:hypothetical protein [bacterium]
MASGLNANKLMSEIKITQYDFDPDSTESTAVGWVDMRDFSKFLVGFFRTVGTSNITLLIKAATSAAGANAQTIVTKTISAQPNAVGDYVFLECLAEQIAQVAATSGYALRYVSAYISFATNTDEGVVTYVQGGPRFAYDGLTADYVS